VVEQTVARPGRHRRAQRDPVSCPAELSMLTRIWRSLNGAP
jgi:hypothetical protein